jgi:hypothetical protein
VEFEQSIPVLENIGDFINNFDMDGDGVATVYADIYLIVVSVGKTFFASANARYAAVFSKQQVPVVNDYGKEGKQQELGGGKKKNALISADKKEDDEKNCNIEASVDVHNKKNAQTSQITQKKNRADRCIKTNPLNL